MKIIKSVEIDTDDLAQLAIESASKLVGKIEGLPDVKLEAKKRYNKDGEWDGFIVYAEGSEPSTNWPHEIEA